MLLPRQGHYWSLVSPTSLASSQFFPFLEVEDPRNLSIWACASTVGLEAIISTPSCRFTQVSATSLALH